MQTPKTSSVAFKVTGNWKNQSNELKKSYSQLTEEDLKFEPGKENELLSRIENRLHKNRAEVINLIKNAQVKKA
jgi:hypothetical protein